VTELYRASLYTDSPEGEIRFILFSQKVDFEVYRSSESGGTLALISRLSLPLSLWEQFYQAVCCLGTFMKPLPAPAHQSRSCCSYTCPPSPESVVLEHDREHIYLSLQERRGSTFLHLRSAPAVGTENSGLSHTICIGPTLWSTFLTTIDNLAQVIADSNF
jgi:hypothetical protein